MAQSDISGSGFRVPPTDRVTASSSYDQRERENNDRRRRQNSRPRHATLADLLFEEVEPDSEQPQEEQRRTPRRPPRRLAAKPATAATPIAAEAHPAPHPPIPAEPEAETDLRIRHATQEAEQQLRIDEALHEARQISTQLRYCLGQHTETARKVSSYLRALLMIADHGFKPHLVIEV